MLIMNFMGSNNRFPIRIPRQQVLDQLLIRWPSTSANQYALIADKFFGLFNCFMRLWELHDPIKTRVAGQPCFGNPNPLQHMHAFHILGKEKGNFLQYPTVKATMTLKEQLLFT